MHKENGGAGAAHNAALKGAQEVYISFVDVMIGIADEKQVAPVQTENIWIWSKNQMMECFFRIHVEK